MKKQLLLLLSVLLTSLTASAFEVDGINYYILSEDDLTCMVSSSLNDNYSGDIVIPSTITEDGKTYTVVAIGNSAFSRCYGLTSVEIPNSVTEIGESAFYCCTNLTSVEIPDAVTSIHYRTFYSCMSLTSVVIPASVTTIGRQAFFNCVKLASVDIPNSVTTIENYAFDQCHGLTSVEIPNSVTSLGVGSFRRCYGLTSVIIGNSVEWIGDQAFWGCTALNEIVSLNPVPPTVADTESFYEVSRTDCIVKVSEGSAEAYKAAPVWNEFFNIEGSIPAKINAAQAADAQRQPVYNLAGQRVGQEAKGIVVKNGKKVLVK